MRNLTEQNIITLTKNDVAELLKEENLLEFNREIKMKHVKKMKESIATLGVLRLPVLAKLNYCESQLAIADMQHGLTAIESMMGADDTIQAIVKECDSKREVVDLVAKLNTTSKGWNDRDYMNCWIEFGGDNEFYGNYVLLSNRLEMTNLSIGLLVDIYTSNKGGFKNGALQFSNPKKSLIVSNFCAYFKAKGYPSFQLTGLSQFLLRNNLSPRELKSFKLRINKLSENHLLPKHRDDFRDLLSVIYQEDNKEFSNRFRA